MKAVEISSEIAYINVFFMYLLEKNRKLFSNWEQKGRNFKRAALQGGGMGY